MKRIKLYTHSGSANHGCEALARTTASLLGGDVILYSMAPEQDQQYGLDRVMEVRADISRPPQKPSLRYYLSAVEIKTKGTTRLHTRFARSQLLREIHTGDVCLSIGGDNYCYGGVETLGDLNDWMHRKGAKTVLWGCSIEPDVLTPAVLADMKRYDLITARETLTLQALHDAGVRKNTLLCADSAFLLETECLPLPPQFHEGHTIGVNVSPLAASCGTGDLVMQNYAALLRYLIEQTEEQVMLVPHVVCSNNDDRTTLRALLEPFADSGRVFLLEDCNAMQLKGFISRCRFFVGARTHATIAAYSSGVPTLTAGYSVKARGIAKDLFGTDENYVAPVQSFASADTLTQRFIWIQQHEAQIRAQLRAVLPDYTRRAYAASERIRKFME